MFGGWLLSFTYAIIGPLSVAIIPTTIAKFEEFKGLRRPVAFINVTMFIFSNMLNGTNEDIFI